MIDELERRVCAHLLAQMPSDPSGELAALDVGTLLAIYGNWRSRYVRPRPRNARLSEELQASSKRLEYKAVVDEIVAAIEAGKDLSPHLSRGILTAYEPTAQRPRNIAGRTDLDLLISDWGLHHLHLTTEMCPDGFYERTGDLLFAKFTDDDAFLIAILGHGRWADKNLLRILVHNWPDRETDMVAMTGLRLVHDPTNDEHLRGRKGALAQPVEIDGTVYFPLGMTTAGTPNDVTMRVHQSIQSMQALRGSLPGELAKIESEFDEKSALLACDGSW